jgi:4-hydroxybenzoate polyprenyltransferase
MLGFQCSIGALNDYMDVDRDRLTQPRKPIPAGLVDARTALLVAIAGGALGLAISAAFGAAVVLCGALGYGCGLAYDLALRARGLGWACLAGAFPLLLAWTWLAASGSLPPGWPLVLPLAALAGPVIHLANSLVDLDADARTGTPSLARSLGRARAARLLVALTLMVQLLAWAVLLGQGAAAESLVIAAGATLLGWLGVGLSSRGGAGPTEAGWLCQAVAMALLAVAWAASVHA